MSEKQSVGQSIVQAVNFLGQVYEDVGKLIESLDEAMERRGWVPINKNRVSDWLSNTLDPDRWLLPAVYRCYIPSSSFAAGKTAKKVARAAAIVVNFCPPETHTEAICLLTAARLPKPMPCSEFWDKWDSDIENIQSYRLLEFLADKAGVQWITNGANKLLREALFPGAESGFAFTVPLCRLADAQVVSKEIVEPLLKEAEKLACPESAKSDVAQPNIRDKKR